MCDRLFVRASDSGSNEADRQRRLIARAGQSLGPSAGLRALSRRSSGKRGSLAFGLLELASARYRRIRVDADVFETVSL